VTVREALEGLPVRISPFWKEEDGWRKVGDMESTFFSRKISGGIPKGVGDKEAIKKYRNENEVSGCIGTTHTPKIKERYGLLKYGEMDKVSKAQRLDPGGFCPTLRAGTGRDKGSFQAVRPVHFSSNRVITPREAARLQGFPDWFIFHRTKWHSFRQIGNSVSPIVSEYLLKKIKDQTNI
jgi:DNA (cytosine-5)-methyltransferase 1